MCDIYVRSALCIFSKQDRVRRSEKSVVTQKLDQVLAVHEKAEADSAARWKAMMEMWDRQHNERLTVLKNLIDKLN